MIEYVDMVGNLAQESKTRGKTPEDASVEAIPDPFGDWQFCNFFLANLKFFYESLPLE
jgi:hypothetical protein